MSYIPRNCRPAPRAPRLPCPEQLRTGHSASHGTRLSRRSGSPPWPPGNALPKATQGTIGLPAGNTAGSGEGSPPGPSAPSPQLCFSTGHPAGCEWARCSPHTQPALNFRQFSFANLQTVLVYSSLWPVKVLLKGSQHSGVKSSIPVEMPENKPWISC